MLPIKFWLNLTYGLEEMSFEEFQNGCHGGHLGYRNGTILAILNLYNAPMPQSNLRFGKRCRLKNSNMATMVAILDIRTKKFKQF